MLVFGGDHAFKWNVKLTGFRGPTWFYSFRKTKPKMVIDVNSNQDYSILTDIVVSDQQPKYSSVKQGTLLVPVPLFYSCFTIMLGIKKLLKIKGNHFKLLKV